MTILILKPLIKYPVALFILLVIGYTQVFAQLYKTNLPPALKRITKSEAVQALTMSGTENEEIYIEEEEDKRISSKKHIANTSFFLATHGLEYFLQKNISYSHTSKHYSRFASVRSSYIVLRVFRL